MRLGVHLVSFDFDGGVPAIGPTVAAFGRAAEEAAIDNISLMDHYFQMEVVGPPGLNMLEGYATLGFLAAVTSKIELQLLVTGATYRHPGLLAKIVSTVDVLSGGRAVLGIGAAWYEAEHLALGVPFPPLAERFERLEETLQIVHAMWSDEESAYDGKHYQLGRTLNRPQPLRTPQIMIGGQGERKTLRLVAQYGDACNLFASPNGAPAIEHKLDVLRGHCERVGTDYERIRKTITWTGPIDPRAEAGEFVEATKPYADLGISDVHVMYAGTDPVGFVKELGRTVVPALHEV
ncbi:MAG: LLM class F420-dependent oxidoreductase [Actinomycetota bacterium]|nr:LLM class F420-dependent oxidoreductase [Actinomycetota bacterium]